MNLREVAIGSNSVLENSKNNIIASLSELVSNKDTFLDLISKVDPDGMTEIMSSGSRIFSVLRAANNILEKIRIHQFLIGLYESISEFELDESEVREYLEKDKVLITILDVIESSHKSNSIKCSLILGYYAGGLLSEKLEILYKDRIVIQALKIMFDDDLDNFVALYEFVNNNPDVMVDNSDGIQLKRFELRLFDIREKIEAEGIPYENTILTIEKLKGIQAVGYNLGGFGSAGNAWSVFKFNEYSDYLYEIIKKAC